MHTGASLLGGLMVDQGGADQLGVFWRKWCGVMCRREREAAGTESGGVTDRHHPRRRGLREKNMRKRNQV